MHGVLRGRAALIGAIGAAILALTGCGKDGRVTVVTPPFAPPTVANRYPIGTPARAAARLYLAMVYDDPTTATRFLVPRWKLSPRDFSVAHAFADALGSDPRLRAQSRHGSRAEVVFDTGTQLAVLDLELVKGSWKVDEVRLGTLKLAAPGTAHEQRSHR